MVIPRVAVFTPIESKTTDFQALFSQHDYSIRWVDSSRDILDSIRDETQDFDLIILPVGLASNISPISACLQCRTEPQLHDTPILVYAGSQVEASTLAGFYGSGADVVILQPLAAEAFYLQVCALARIKKQSSDRLNKQLHSSAIEHPVVQAFESMREGFLLFDVDFNLVFVNSAALNMLGSANNPLTNIPESVARQFVPWIKEHVAECQLAEDEKQSGFKSTFEADLLRSDGQSFSTSVSITAIVRESGEAIGQAVYLTDLEEIHHLGNILMQGQRTRSLCLLASSACQQLIGDMLGGTLLAPFRAIQQYLDSKPAECQIEVVLADLMEMLDLLINPNVSIKINLAEDCQLAVSSSDLFVLLGHLVLHAVEHAGVRGEVLVTSTPVEHTGLCALMITSQTRRQSFFANKDRIGRLIQHNLESLTSVKDLTDKSSIAMQVAQNIAETYNTTIDFQAADDTTMRLRIRLPALR